MVASVFPLVLKAAQVSRKQKSLLGPIDLTVTQGSFTAVIGPNGAGKTTLLRLMHGVERLTSGCAEWAVPDAIARAHQAYVFQQPIMLRRSVADNLSFPLELIKTPKVERSERVLHWAEKIGFSSVLQTQATRLSGGERQKLALGRALIRAPQVLFLDEPCANLDGASTREIEALLRATHAAGTTIILVTHDIAQARRLATDALFLHAGQIVEEGAAEAVLHTPKSPILKSFLNGEIIT